MENDKKIQKRPSRELFPPKNDFKSSSAVYFPKKTIQILETWKLTKDMKLWVEFCFPMIFYIWTQYNIKIGLDTVGKIWKKNHQTRLKNWI